MQFFLKEDQSLMNYHGEEYLSTTAVLKDENTSSVIALS